MAELASERPVVLIVEDEFLIRMASAEAIRDAGFEVLEAANADEAIGILESRRDIRVVFTDIQMPGSMDGAKLAHFQNTLMLLHRVPLFGIRTIKHNPVAARGV
jgi:CheY-like chemotaxis protein